MNKIKSTQQNGLNVRDTTSNIIPFVIPFSGQEGTMARLARGHINSCSLNSRGSLALDLQQPTIGIRI